MNSFFNIFSLTLNRSLRFYPLLSIIFYLLSSLPLSAQTVSNVTAKQVEKTIHVSYDLDEPADVTLLLSTDGGLNYTELHHVRGHVGVNVPAGHNTIVWDVLAEQESLVGEDVMFKVRATGCIKPCPNSPTIQDYDGNTYKTVQIGKQCWMAENLRTTHYSDGKEISFGKSVSSFYAWYYSPSNDVTTYGFLYNWKAVMRNFSSSAKNPSGVQGICPNEWHVPSDAEWTELTDYVRGQSQYVCGSVNGIAKALASSTGWRTCSKSCSVGYSKNLNNATGFDASPAGCYHGSYDDFNDYAYFWSSTELDSNRAYCRYINSFFTYVSMDDRRKYNGYSVRCLKD